MSNQYINIRFGKWHLQVMRDRPYISFRLNTYWNEYEYTKWFCVYTWFGKHWDD